jgi:hypothetical protein
MDRAVAIAVDNLLCWASGDPQNVVEPASSPAAGR